MNDMRKYIKLVESAIESADDIIPGELPKYNTLAKQLAAVQKYGPAIEYIKNPSEEVKLAAVQKTGWAIEYIPNPSENVKLAAVSQDGHAIQFISNPSEIIQLAAVQQDGHAIQFISNPSEIIQLAAIKRSRDSIYYILNNRIIPSVPVQKYAVIYDTVNALNKMIWYKIPISKMILWTAAKKIKELNLKIKEDILSKLDPDVQEYLKDNIQ